MAQSRRRMRSGTVMLGGMGLLAAALASCGSEPDRRCVDRDSYVYGKGYKVVADQNCSRSSGSARQGRTSRTSDATWYYDADTSRGYAKHGTFERSKAVDRGGFGGSGSGGG